MELSRVDKPTILKAQIFESSEGNVWKYVFEIPSAVTESVLYRYQTFQNRTVLCCSVQSGCPVKCSFCGAGESFLRNLRASEITEQADFVFKDKAIDTANVRKLQIMFMSMGEPFLNYDNVEKAIRTFNACYDNAQLLVSTIAPNREKDLARFIELSREIDRVGLQFSIHRSTDEERNKLIPYRNKLTLTQIAEYGRRWAQATGRRPFCNYCVEGNNDADEDFERLRRIFEPEVFNFTFSVYC
jgi:23S rRNA (adenine2503-C2)-methyltransferase